MVAYPSCIRPSIVSLTYVILCLVGYQGFGELLPIRLVGPPQKVDGVEHASHLVNLSTDVSLKIKCQVS